VPPSSSPSSSFLLVRHSTLPLDQNNGEHITNFAERYTFLQVWRQRNKQQRATMKFYIDDLPVLFPYER
jgi:hypothetical protein